MNVREVLTVHIPVCQAAGSWRRAAEALWECDAGIVVVLDANQRPLGVLSERDICRAVATREVLPHPLSAGDLVSGPAPYCRPDDDVRTALRRLMVHRIRSMPVVAQDGTMVGLVSIPRIVLRAKEGTDWSPRELAQVLGAVWAEHLLPEDAMLCGWEHH